MGVEEKENGLIVFFSPPIDIEEVRERLATFIYRLSEEGVVPGSHKLQVEVLPRQSWQENWKSYFRPIDVNGRLWVIPSWETPPPVEDRIVVTIDPEQAFGTGGHATTYLMLQALVENPVEERSVLDAGTGSGILAISAAKFGAGRIVAFDMDATAVATAKKNAEKNQVAEKIIFFVGELFALKPGGSSFDLILANISLSVLKTLIPSFAPHLRGEKGLLILSGVLLQEEKQLFPIFTRSGLQVVQRWEREEWLCLICTRTRSFRRHFIQSSSPERC